MDDEILIIRPPSDEPETDDEDEVDELVQEVTELKTVAQGNTEILGRIEICLQRLEVLSQERNESPLLTEIKTELAELRVELASVKESLVSQQRNPELNPLPELPVETVTETSLLDEPEVGASMGVAPDGATLQVLPVENKTPRRVWV